MQYVKYLFEKKSKINYHQPFKKQLIELIISRNININLKKQYTKNELYKILNVPEIIFKIL